MKTSRLSLYLMFLFLACSFQAGAVEKSTLYLEFKQQSGFIEEISVLKDSRKTLRLDTQKGALNKRLVRLNVMLEKYQKHSDEEFKEELEELGSIFYEPISQSIESCDIVAIEIPPAMIRFPFEHLFFKGKPLGLQKPIFVHFGEYSKQPFAIADIESSLVLADLTADPEEACRKASKELPNARYHSFDNLEQSSFKHLRKHDLLLVSAHGDISFSDEDCIDFEEESIYPDAWANVAPQLVYFDSCQLGVSHEFIKAFREAGTRYFVAPVTSNEAGNSSTKTIESFFDGLLKGESPERALFLTKTTLFEKFSHDKKSTFGKLLYRAMPFRVYRLN